MHVPLIFRYRREREASETSYYKDDETLWVKLVASNEGGQAAAGPFGATPDVTVSR